MDGNAESDHTFSPLEALNRVAPMMAMDSESPFANGVSLRPRSLKKRSTSGSSGDGEELLQSERYHCVEPGKCLKASVAVVCMN